MYRGESHVLIAWWEHHKENDADMWFFSDLEEAIDWCRKNCLGYLAAMIYDKCGNVVFKFDGKRYI